MSTSLSLSLSSSSTIIPSINPERDVELWLANKLEESWSSERLSNFLTSAILNAVIVKYDRIDPIIKLKLLFSFLTLRKLNVKQMGKEVGVNDDDVNYDEMLTCCSYFYF
jgi:hypothetical protein